MTNRNYVITGYKASLEYAATHHFHLHNTADTKAPHRFSRYVIWRGSGDEDGGFGYDRAEIDRIMEQIND